MHIVVVGPKVTPPWDSAAASLGRGLLQALAYLGSRISVITTRVSLKRVVQDYGTLSSAIKDFEMFHEGNVKIDWYIVEHDCNSQRTEAKLAILTYHIARRIGADVIFYVGFPRNPLTIRLISKVCKVVVLYTYTIPSTRYLLFLKCLSNHIRKFRLLICTTSVIAYKIIKKCTDTLQAYIVPPIVDTRIFRPIDNAYRSTRFDDYSSCLHVGYVGPMHPSRFPVDDIVKALALLKRRGVKVMLHVRGVLRHGRRDLSHVYTTKKILEKILGRENVDLSIGQLSRESLKEFYNNIDILLYVFMLNKSAEIADPPLVPLEALSSGALLISSLGSSLDYYLKPLSQIGVVRLVRRRALDIAKAICELSLINKSDCSDVVHRYIDQMFSPNSVSLKIKEILDNAAIALRVALG